MFTAKCQLPTDSNDKYYFFPGQNHEEEFEIKTNSYVYIVKLIKYVLTYNIFKLDSSTELPV